MRIEVADEVLCVADMDSVCAPCSHESRCEYPLAGTLQPADNERDLARFPRFLEHPRGPSENIVEMVIIAGADDLAHMLAQQVPISRRWLDRKSGPQIPACLRRVVSRIEH